MSFTRLSSGLFCAFALIAFSSCAAAKEGALAARSAEARAHFTLAADDWWQLNSPGGIRFDASGLVFFRRKLLTISDRGPELFEIALASNHVAELKSTGWFPRTKMPSGFANRFDCEGITSDSAGNLYICEESKRRVFKTGPDGASISTLEIDWSPVKKYFSPDSNASFEGIAVGGGVLYLANERESPRIIEVDPDTLKVMGSFAVDSDGFAFGGAHYSDLSFADNHLFILDRNHRAILETDPATRKVVAEYSFGSMEVSEDFAYKTLYPTGTMEGLAVDADYFWLVTDNNGLPRIKHPNDTRPSLFRCKRPERQARPQDASAKIRSGPRGASR